MTRPEVASLPAQRRRQARQFEWAEQTALVAQLREMLDHSVFWMAVDNQPWSKAAGIRRKQRGCRAGAPDLLILHKGALIGIEMKSRVGRVSWAQKEVRREMVRAGGSWFLCRTARSALAVLHRQGVPLRNRQGQLWRPPLLPAWEEPVSDLDQPMVWHPQVLRQWREDKERWRARAKARRAEALARAAQPPSELTDAGARETAD